MDHSPPADKQGDGQYRSHDLSSPKFLEEQPDSQHNHGIKDFEDPFGDEAVGEVKYKTMTWW